MHSSICRYLRLCCEGQYAVLCQFLKAEMTHAGGHHRSRVQVRSHVLYTPVQENRKAKSSGPTRASYVNGDRREEKSRRKGRSFSSCSSGVSPRAGWRRMSSNNKQARLKNSQMHDAIDSPSLPRFTKVNSKPQSTAHRSRPRAWNALAHWGPSQSTYIVFPNTQLRGAAKCPHGKGAPMWFQQLKVIERVQNTECRKHAAAEPPTPNFSIWRFALREVLYVDWELGK